MMRIKIAVAINDHEGAVTALGGNEEGDQSRYSEEACKDLVECGYGVDRVVWVTVDIPDPVNIVGTVEEETT